MVKLKKNIKVGKIKTLNLIFFYYLSFLVFFANAETSNNIMEDKKFIEIKILDKVSSKNTKLVLKIGEEKKFQDLMIKSLKCKNSEFDDNPEVTAYLQVVDIRNTKNDEVFVFNGWTFSSSPTIRPFDHPVYDIWLTRCF
ncbi:DUF2155 domain-containing protein [Candidatus Pelagibacter sp.]|nr:DUF2155 domain-containing protein [Candidatus Pelagibacter sp.]|tara:strand:- start:78 stop:497 length:420 start_codon:yes stop_codon:yes gene_type:complete